ncbi:MAG: small subunit ribosomal protein [Candidatus Petromonas sp.]|nr:small subunit ribosomal protein [Candidatus Petromonas sp.]
MSKLANIKSAKKRIKVIAKKTAQNKRRKSKVKTAIRRFEDAVAAGDLNLAKEKFNYAQKKISQIAAKNTIHKNAASRKISRLAKKLKQLEKAAE